MLVRLRHFGSVISASRGVIRDYGRSGLEGGERNTLPDNTSTHRQGAGLVGDPLKSRMARFPF